MESAEEVKRKRKGKEGRFGKVKSLLIACRELSALGYMN
jgi:hypothetical protein